MPAQQYRDKKLNYRRAEFLQQSGKTLEVYLNEAHTKFPEISQRRVSLQGQPILEGRKHVKDLGGIGTLLHIAAYTPGEHASIVPKSDSEDVSTTPPPRDSEFMDGDIMALVVGNHVFLCSSNISDKRAERYMIGIIEAAALERMASNFCLCKKADIDKVALLQSKGVKSINLNACLFDATLDHAERTTVQKKLRGGLMDEIVSIFAEDRPEEDILSSENLSAKIILSFDSRKKRIDVARQGIFDLAEKMFENEEDSFSITTLGGETINGSDISLRKTVKLPKHGKSVFFSDAWKALEVYYTELKDAGVLEQ